MFTTPNYKLIRVTSTEEMILNTKWPNAAEPAIGWRRFRIEYCNDYGHSNIEGCLYFPPDIDPYPILDALEEAYNKKK